MDNFLKGRINRQNFIAGFFVLFLAVITAVFFLRYIAENIPAYSIIFGVLSTSFSGIGLVLLLSLSIRRSHDLGWDGYWVALIFVFSSISTVTYFFSFHPDVIFFEIIMDGVMGLLLFILAIKKGEEKQNKFGPVPE